MGHPCHGFFLSIFSLLQCALRFRVRVRHETDRQIDRQTDRQRPAISALCLTLGGSGGIITDVIVLSVTHHVQPITDTITVLFFLHSIMSRRSELIISVTKELLNFIFKCRGRFVN